MLRHLTSTLLVTFLLLAGSSGKPQNPSLEGIIDDVFQLGSSKTPKSKQQSRGFGVIVTPVPPGASQDLIQTNSITGRAACNCVRYHMCDPSTNEVTDDGSFDGFGLIDLRFGVAENDPVCEHPLDICCASNQTRTVSLQPTPQEQRPNRARGCGVRNVGGIDFNITGATPNDAGYGEFPWTVALLHSGNHSYFCAGSIIHPRVILTAAHCLRDHQPATFLVRAGEWDTQTQRERLPYEERTVNRVLIHPKFNIRNVAYNFALVLLDEAVTLGDHINTVCLPPANLEPTPRTTCYATGWGKDLFGAKGRFSVIMKKVPLPIVDHNTCQNQLRTTRLGAKFALDRSFICAGGELGVDTCEGDGGAPLACPVGNPSDNRYEQSGIVSWGIGCKDQIPAAYANLAQGREWIDDQMLAYGFATSTYIPPQ